MSTKKLLASYEVQTPDFFSPAKAEDWKWIVPTAERFQQANELAKKHNIGSAALDRYKIAVLVVDYQNGFCHPDFELFVGGQSGRGAMDDAARLCDWGYRNMRVITQWYPTLDTHYTWQIFHPSWIVDEKGNAPDARFPMLFNVDDIVKGHWRLNPKAAFAVTGNAATYNELQQHLIYYAQEVTRGGKLPFTMWPFHVRLGSNSHCLMPVFDELLFVHGVARGVNNPAQIKGDNPLVENYSIFKPEVLQDRHKRAIAQRNADFLDLLMQYDTVIIAGQASSHCVAWTLYDLRDEIMKQDPALAKKCYILRDCCSPVVVPNVVDFTEEGEKAFKECEAAGMNIVDTTVPIEAWPGVDASRLNL